MGPAIRVKGWAVEAEATPFMANSQSQRSLADWKLNDIIAPRLLLARSGIRLVPWNVSGAGGRRSLCVVPLSPDARDLCLAKLAG